MSRTVMPTCPLKLAPSAWTALSRSAAGWGLVDGRVGADGRGAGATVVTVSGGGAGRIGWRPAGTHAPRLVTAARIPARR